MTETNTAVFRPVPVYRPGDAFQRAGNGSYELQERFCYPMTSVRLRPEGDGFRVRILAVDHPAWIDVGAVQSLRQCQRYAVQRVRYNDDLIAQLGVSIDYAFRSGETVRVLQDATVAGQVGTVRHCSIEEVEILLHGEAQTRTFRPHHLLSISERRYRITAADGVDVLHQVNGYTVAQFLFEHHPIQDEYSILEYNADELVTTMRGDVWLHRNVAFGFPLRRRMRVLASCPLVDRTRTPLAGRLVSVEGYEGEEIEVKIVGSIGEDYLIHACWLAPDHLTFHDGNWKRFILVRQTDEMLNERLTAQVLHPNAPEPDTSERWITYSEAQEFMTL